MLKEELKKIADRLQAQFETQWAASKSYCADAISALWTKALTVFVTKSDNEKTLLSFVRKEDAINASTLNGQDGGQIKGELIGYFNQLAESLKQSIKSVSASFALIDVANPVANSFEKLVFGSFGDAKTIKDNIYEFKFIGVGSFLLEEIPVFDAEGALLEPTSQIVSVNDTILFKFSKGKVTGITYIADYTASTIQDIQGKLVDIDKLVNGLTSKLDDLSQTVSTNTTDVSSLKEQLDLSNEKAGLLSQKIFDAALDLEKAKSNLADTSTKVSDANTRIETVELDLNRVKLDFDTTTKGLGVAVLAAGMLAKQVTDNELELNNVKISSLTREYFDQQIKELNTLITEKLDAIIYK
jgi:hypothetical protein